MEESTESAELPQGHQPLRERRLAVGISQVELGRLADVNRATIRNAETGQSLQGRTLANILRSLGCAAVVATADVPLVPILSAATTRTVVRALLTAHERPTRPDPGQDWETTWRRSFVIPYMKIIDAAAAANRGRVRGLGLPDEFDYFRASLKSWIPREELQQFDRDLTRWFGSAYPYHHDFKPDRVYDARGRDLAPGLGRLTPSGAASPYEEIRRILQLDIPREDQERLVAHMQQRREELTAAMNETLLRELSTLIKFVAGEHSDQSEGGVIGGDGQEDQQ